ncbi:MAG: HDOD domain-containing protein [Desulfovibrionaceae bacterium]|jgi:putative nucleotidyltransferase with HDIG domain|nr:HDOD domain-containing protein [Desulfovibrionaceae bacterium]
MEQKLSAAIDKMPAFPKSVQRVLALAADIDCSPADLVDVIKHDPIFTLKVLKVVNSPFVGLRQKITSINQASVYLGVNTLKNLALGLASIGALPRRNKAGFDMEAFWLHSLATGVAARELAAELKLETTLREDLFSAGLLHDVGKAVFALYMPEEYRLVLAELAAAPQTSLLRAEAAALGLSHPQMGARLARKWALPALLHDALALHHTTDAAPLPALCVQGADLAVKSLGHFYAAEPMPLAAPAVCELFGRDIGELASAMPDFDKHFQKARIFIEV